MPVGSQYLPRQARRAAAALLRRHARPARIPRPVLNALVLFNTRYLDAVLTQLNAEGYDVARRRRRPVVPVRRSPQ
jgi:hypothetical protein